MPPDVPEASGTPEHAVRNLGRPPVATLEAYGVARVRCVSSERAREGDHIIGVRPLVPRRAHRPEVGLRGFGGARRLPVERPHDRN